MSLILCIESGTDVGSVALARDGVLLSLMEANEGREHARNLAVYIEEMLRVHDVEPDMLDAVAVGKGPGSYTGLRIAVSMAKGICYATGAKLIGVNSLEALVHVALEDFEAGILGVESLDDAVLLPMIDARRMEIYCQLFDDHAKQLSEVEAHVLTPESFEKQRQQGNLFLFGNGAPKAKELFAEKGVQQLDITPSARGIVKPAFEAFEQGRFEDIAYFEPFYLKDFVVTASKKKFF